MTYAPSTPSSSTLLTGKLLVKLGWQMWWVPTRFVLQCQYTWVNQLTLGMLDDLAEEVEHALVEGNDAVTLLVDKIQQLQQMPVTEEQRHMVVQTLLQESEQQISQIIQELISRVLALPFNRLDDKPARRRFPVVIEG